MRISEITLDVLKNYIHVYHDEDNTLLEAINAGSLAFIESYTGLSADTLDLKADISIAHLVLCAEMYDNRSYSVDNHEINPVVRTILHMYSTNNL
jgi:uncharacterized phage protein (predicted DNA packaging)